MVHGLACSIELWMHLGSWESTKLGEHEVGRARSWESTKLREHEVERARSWESTKLREHEVERALDFECSPNFPSASI